MDEKNLDIYGYESIPWSRAERELEGTAKKVTDEPTLQRLAELYDSQGWPATVKDGFFTAPFSAPSAGPPPWDLYGFTPTTAFGVATAEPHGAMRWRFGA